MLEKTVEKKLRKQVMSVGGLCLKFESPGFSGVPDRVLLLPGGKVAFAETKQPGKTERKRQEYVHRLFRELGFTVFSTVDGDDKIQEIIRYCEEVQHG